MTPLSRTSTHRPILAALVVLLLTACATPPMDRVQELARAGRHAEALALLDDQARQRGDSVELRAERARVVQAAVYPWLAQAEWARSAGRNAQARGLLQQALALDPSNARAASLLVQVERAERADAALAQAREELRANRPEAARALAEQALRDSPRHAAARALLAQLAPVPAADPLGPVLSEAYRKPVTLDFRDAPLRSVFEALQRTHGVNFVFDRELRADTKVTLMLRDTPLDEALRVLLASQQLERKVLNANTVLIYPATQVKLREHQELVTRTLYLVNADVKSVLALVRGIAKSQDLQGDERLNAIVVRDTPSTVKLIEDLVAAVDLPDPEVMIDVEVLEVNKSKVTDLGVNWPSSVSYGVFNDDATAPASVLLSRSLTLRGAVANPLLLATLHASDSNTRTLANPTIRARNREKAQVHVGDKLPVFTTTSTANVGVSASVNYLDVGIKLDVEPSVQLDDDVVIKVGLEVSNVVQKVAGPQDSVAYQIGTRRTSTTLRLRDGETQILAGLVKDEDGSSVEGLPGLSRLPLAGALFGTHGDTRNKTEVVLLMTPHVLRSLPLPDARVTQRPGGTAANPGAEPMRISERARVVGGLAAAGSLPPGPSAPPSPQAAAAPKGPPTLELATGGAVAVGEVATVTLDNTSDYTLKGELRFDPALLRNAAAGAGETPSVAFQLAPGTNVAYLLRVLPAAAGASPEVTAAVTEVLDGLRPLSPGAVVVGGSGRIDVRPPR